MKEQQRLLSHSSVEAFRFDSDVKDRYYIPWRTAAEAAARIQKGEKVLTILPTKKEFNEYLTFLSTTLLDGKSIPTLFTPDEDYLMDIDIKNYLLPELFDRTNHGSMTIVHPYQATPEFYEWASTLEEERGVKIYADPKKEDDRFWWGHKGAYHRWMDDLQTASPYELLGLPMAKGFLAQNKAELSRAKTMLPTDEVVVKGIHGAGGYEIQFLKTQKDIDDYEWPYDPLTKQHMPVAVQEKLSIAHDEFGERSYSLQFSGQELFGRLTRQIMNGREWVGNRIPSGVSEEFEQKALAIAKVFLQNAKPVGDGGIDIADVNGEPYIIEVNGGRPTGATMPKRFKDAFAINAPHFIFQKVTPGAMTAHEAWDILQGTNIPGSHQKIVFQTEQQTGVFPIVWLNDSWALLGSFGKSFEEANAQLLQARYALGV